MTSSTVKQQQSGELRKLFDILTCRPVSCIKRGCQTIVGNPLSMIGGSMDDDNAGDHTENSNLFI